MLTKIPHGRAEIERVFGSLSDPRFEQKNLVYFDLPYPLRYAGVSVARARCHRLAVDHFVKAFENVKAAGFADQFVEFNGIYARRAARGSVGQPSTHSWGIAIDMEASRYPLGGLQRMPDAIVKCFTDAAFFYGGDFGGRKDPMHFQLATGY